MQTFTNNETNMQSEVTFVPSPLRHKSGNAYRVTLHDLDSGQTVPMVRFFSTLEAAADYAERIAMGISEPDAVVSVPVWNS